jgi:hypothetical protein
MVIKKYMVLGAGQFGIMAALKLVQLGHVTVVDNDADSLQTLGNDLLETVCAEGLAYLAKTENLRFFNWIVPALPQHVAFEWLHEALKKDGIQIERIPFPEGIKLPNCIQGDKGRVYASLSSELCPDNCPEPPGVCFSTGEVRTHPLHKIISETVSPDYQIKVLQSKQLAPGVGGYTPGSLLEVYRWAVDLRTAGILATSCSCHAVLDAFIKK